MPALQLRLYSRVFRDDSLYFCALKQGSVEVWPMQEDGVTRERLMGQNACHGNILRLRSGDKAL